MSGAAMDAQTPLPARRPWRHRLGHSLKGRLVALFLLLALAMSAAFMFGMQRALSSGWRDAVKPLLADYVDRLAADLGSPPEPAKIQALVARLPVSVRVEGPLVQIDTHPRPNHDHWQRGEFDRDADSGRLLQRRTNDGHLVTFGLGDLNWRRSPGIVGWVTLSSLLALTAIAYLYVRRLLKPLEDIGAGAKRFGVGDFTTPIAVKRRDELGELASQINTMGDNIHQMLEAKRALLLAISHELRSPLTRARLNAELLSGGSERDALLRDLGEMRDLITDLLESERLAGGHAALHTESTDLNALVTELTATSFADRGIVTELAADLPLLPLDRTRWRLLMRNLLDNALRHGATADTPVRLSTRRDGDRVCMTVRDHGPGVPEAQLAQLGVAFYRPDSARQRATGGVGLGLHLCRLVAQAHGASWVIRNAAPGLAVDVCLPAPEV